MLRGGVSPAAQAHDRVDSVIEPFQHGSEAVRAVGAAVDSNLPPASPGRSPVGVIVERSDLVEILTLRKIELAEQALPHHVADNQAVPLEADILSHHVFQARFLRALYAVEQLPALLDRDRRSDFTHDVLSGIQCRQRLRHVQMHRSRHEDQVDFRFQHSVEVGKPVSNGMAVSGLMQPLFVDIADRGYFHVLVRSKARNQGRAPARASYADVEPLNHYEGPPPRGRSQSDSKSTGLDNAVFSPSVDVGYGEPPQLTRLLYVECCINSTRYAETSSVPGSCLPDPPALISLAPRCGADMRHRQSIPVISTLNRPR